MEEAGQERREDAKQRLRQRQWLYMGPIAAAPLAHIAVSLLRHAKTPMQRGLIVGVGVVGSTAATLGMRVYLMGHAGYAGGDLAEEKVKERFKEVSKVMAQAHRRQYFEEIFSSEVHKGISYM